MHQTRQLSNLACKHVREAHIGSSFCESIVLVGLHCLTASLLACKATVFAQEGWTYIALLVLISGINVIHSAR